MLEALRVGIDEVRSVDTQRHQEGISHLGHECLGEHPGVVSLVDRFGHGQQRLSAVARCDGFEERLDRFAALQHPTGRDDLIESGERVAHRTATTTHGVGDRLLVDVEAGILHHPADVVGQLRRREQVEIEMLRATPDGRENLLRVGRRQHETDVFRRFLERLQQRV